MREHATSSELMFRDPVEHQPPLGQSMILLTPGGTMTVGQWDPRVAVAWAPKPKIPSSIKARLAEVAVRGWRP